MKQHGHRNGKHETMEYCKVSGAEIISSSQWIFRDPAKNYATRIKRIGKNILFAWVDSDKPVVLETFEEDLVRKVLEDSGLENKPVYFIWNLENVKGITYAYKRGIVDFLYNPSPPLNCVVFYNTIPEFLNTTESIQAILPSSLQILFAESYRQAIKLVLDVKGGENASHAPDDEYEELKKSFLAATARIGWLNMLHPPVSLPHPEHELFPFFNAISFLQKDLIEHEELYREKKLRLEKACSEKTKEIDASISSIEEKKEKLLAQFADERSSLENALALRKHESRTIGATLKSRGAELRKTVTDITNLPISLQQKKQMLDICNDLLESERNQRTTGLPLTTTDSAFLSLLHQQHPNLNNREQKVCLLIKLDYDNTEIADYYAITKRGMESLRYRMHKKIGLKKNQSLKNHLISLAEKLGTPP